MMTVSNSLSNGSQQTRFGTTHGNLRTSHVIQRQRNKDLMPKTLRNQEPAYAELYDKLVAVGYERIPYHS